MKAEKLTHNLSQSDNKPVIGVFATCDPRIDKDSRSRAGNIIKMTADILAEKINMPDGQPTPVVY